MNKLNMLQPTRKSSKDRETNNGIAINKRFANFIEKGETSVRRNLVKQYVNVNMCKNSPIFLRKKRYSIMP